MKPASAKLIMVLVCISLSFMTGGCGMKELDSVWRDREVVIDGLDGGAEWEGARYFYDEQKVTIGVFNDDRYLYVRLSSRNSMTQRMMLAGGMTIWFDPTGKKGKSYGIHCPLGDTNKSDTTNGKAPDRTMNPGERRENLNRLEKMVEQAQKRVELIGPEEGVKNTMILAEVYELGIEVRLDVDKGNLVYELKVPLARSSNSPYGIGVEESGIISFGIESGSITMPNRSGGRPDGKGDRGGGGGGRGGGIGGRGGGGRSGGMGGGGMGGGRSGGGGMRPGSEPINERIEFWLKCRLAQPVEADA